MAGSQGSHLRGSPHVTSWKEIRGGGADREGSRGEQGGRGGPRADLRTSVCSFQLTSTPASPSLCDPLPVLVRPPAQTSPAHASLACESELPSVGPWGGDGVVPVPTPGLTSGEFPGVLPGQGWGHPQSPEDRQRGGRTGEKRMREGKPPLHRWPGGSWLWTPGEETREMGTEPTSSRKGWLH